MDWLLPVVIAVTCALALAGVLVLVIGGLARRLERQRAQEVLARFAGREILGLNSNALFFGQASKGVGQLRGNGVLVLTPARLFFEMWAPRRELSIPVASITSVSTPRSHLGRTSFRPLLEVKHKDEQGRGDSSAWLIQNVETWHAALERLVALRTGAGSGTGGDGE
jgi:hypothetical protein